MATQFIDPNDPDNPKKPVVPQGDPAYAPLSALSAGAASAPSTKPANSSGQFVSFDRLLNANQGVGQGVANQLTSSATQAADKAGQTLTKDSSLFNTAVQQGTPQLQGVQAPAGLSSPSSAYAGGGYDLSIGVPNAGAPVGLKNSAHNASIATDPLSAMELRPPTAAPPPPDPSTWDPTIASLQSQAANANYAGPASPSGYFDDAATQAADAAGQLRDLDTVSGRQAQTGALLDALLAGAQGGQSLHRAAAGAGALGTNLDNALTASGQKVTDASTSATALKNSLNTRLGSAQTAQNNAIKAQADAAQAEQARAAVDAQYKQYVDAYQANRFWSGDWYGAGISAGDFAALTPDQQAFLAGGGFKHARDNRENAETWDQIQQTLKTRASAPDPNNPTGPFSGFSGNYNTSGYGG